MDIKSSGKCNKKITTITVAKELNKQQKAAEQEVKTNIKFKKYVMCIIENAKKSKQDSNAATSFILSEENNKV